MNISALLEQLESLTKNPPAHVIADDSIRIKLRDAARDLSVAMESKGDTVHRIGSLVCCLFSSVLIIIFCVMVESR